MSLSLTVADLAGTAALGRALADALFPGAVIALIGPLGAGKTHLVKAIAEGLEIPNSAVVNSPTFVLIQEYDARLPMYHFDAYRLAGENEFADLGPEEYFQGDGVSLIEWADKVPGCLPNERLEIRIVPMGETSRGFELTAAGERYDGILEAIRSRFAMN
jgi:tRNA threonylcarbamoyladenosine biosynthesis protein TsaE